MKIQKPLGEDRYRTFNEEKVLANLIVNGWRFETVSGGSAEAGLAARAALELCVGLGLPFVQRAEQRCFDPVEAHNFFRWASARHAEPTWVRHCVSSGRRQAWEIDPGHNDWTLPPPPEALGPRRYQVTIRRSVNLDDRQTGERVRLRLPLPLVDETLRDLAVEILLPQGLQARTTMAPGRLDAVFEAPADKQVTIGVRTAFSASSMTSKKDAFIDEAEFALYTRPVEGLIRVGENIRALAAKLAETETAALPIVRRFWNFMFDHLACGSIHYDKLDPVDPFALVLNEGWYDCMIGSALLASLCRARAIPARLVTGYILHAAAPGFHTWVEAWIDGQGWAPFDLAAWDLSAGGADIAWRDCYFGWVDRRMVVERPPLLFGGLGARRLRGPWHMSSAMSPLGVDISFDNIETGQWLYRDHVVVEPRP